MLLLDELTAALPTDLVERVLRVARAQAQDGRGMNQERLNMVEMALEALRNVIRNNPGENTNGGDERKDWC